MSAIEEGRFSFGWTRPAEHTDLSAEFVFDWIHILDPVLAASRTFYDRRASEVYVWTLYQLAQIRALYFISLSEKAMRVGRRRCYSRREQNGQPPFVASPHGLPPSALWHWWPGQYLHLTSAPFMVMTVREYPQPWAPCRHLQ